MSSSAVFPPLASSTTSLAPSAKDLLHWKLLFSSQSPVSHDFSSSLAHHPTKNFTAHFTKSQFDAGALEWSFSLVGYSIGRRPFYEALLSVIKRTWKLKGELSLLTLDDGFFLLKFSSPEDYDMAWSGGPWFFFGKPFMVAGLHS
ncbi:hypothetical protein KFK09_003050 [Dendrobium nobile]|uniref:DUF4283 domain-containing protein n=1 Tax=Dendrobium nobile TaxID=94219 RepID=A0A8T3C5L9_DENNO|nr:hypothetical protein KFK09_003050 [Dendrobium nobile]